MTLAAIYEWRLPGCGDDCQPRRHDPLAHEAYGARQERLRQVPTVVRSGRLVIDRAARRALVDGSVVVLSDIQWKMLDALAVACGAAVPYAELATAMFGREWVAASDAKALNNNLNTHRGRLRRKLGVAASRVATIPAYGMLLEVDP